jgi:PilZ domain
MAPFFKASSGKDQRKSKRREVHYAARVQFKSGRTAGCVLSDVSDTGARLEVPFPDKVPERFLLWLTSDGSAKRTCRVVWRKSHAIGVTFERRLPEQRQQTLVPLHAQEAKRALIAAMNE